MTRNLGLFLSATFAALLAAGGLRAQSSPEVGSGLRGLYRSIRPASPTAPGRAPAREEPASTPNTTRSDTSPPYFTREKKVRVDDEPPIGRPATKGPLSDLIPDSPKATPRASERSASERPGTRLPSATETPRKTESVRPTEVKPSVPPGEKGEVAPKHSREQPKPRAGFPTTLRPTRKGGYRYRAPKFYEGIYITNPVAYTPRLYRPLLQKARAARLNTLVVDVQPKLPPLEFIRLAREGGFYLVARVVVFPGGLNEYPPRAGRIHRTLDLAERAARTGFMEVQLDYIRFADRIRGQRNLSVSLDKRYRLIEGILKMATDRLRPHGVRVGADVFGRIAFNRDDIIGQKVELFAAHLDTIYPMLYPSHFYGEPHRIRNPYQTVLLGNKNTVERSQGHSKIIAYIQGFRMSVGPSGLSYENYIRKQIAAAEDSGGAGYIVWNARNHYDAFFRALAHHRRAREKARLTHNEDGERP